MKNKREMRKKKINKSRKKEKIMKEKIDRTI